MKVSILYAHEDKKLRDDPDDHLAHLKQQGSGGQSLITSRYAARRGKAQRLEVQKLEREKSVEFLLKRTGKVDETAARKLAETLADLSLALE